MFASSLSWLGPEYPAQCLAVAFSAVFFVISVLVLPMCVKKKKNPDDSKGDEGKDANTQRLSIHREPNVSEKTEETQRPKQNAASVSKSNGPSVSKSKPNTPARTMQTTQTLLERESREDTSRPSLNPAATQTEASRTQSTVHVRTEPTKAVVTGSTQSRSQEAAGKTTSVEGTQDSHILTVEPTQAQDDHFEVDLTQDASLQRAQKVTA